MRGYSIRGRTPLATCERKWYGSTPMYQRAFAWVTVSLVAAACTSSGDDRSTSPLDGSVSGAGGNAGGSAASGGSGGARSNGGSSPGGASTANGGTSSGGSSNGGAGLGGAATGGIPNPGGMPGSGGVPSTGGADAGSPSATRVLYVGTGDGAVLVYEADTTTWALTRRDRTAAGDVLSFLAQSPDRRTLYATDEGAGMVRSFRIDATSGLLTVLPAQTSNGHPTHVAAHPAGRFVLVAHYNEGRVEVFGTATSGAATSAVDEDASGAQAHQAVVSPDGRFVFVPNKGANTISQYLFDSATGALSPNTPPSVASEAGAGPRHLAFTPDGRYAYVIDELGSRVEAFGYDAATGRLARFQAEDSLPAGFAGTSTGAEIAVSPSGRFLYCSNRIGGADGDIAIFAIGATDGRLTLVDHESTRGRTPRHFSLDPTGEALFVANQASQEIVVFRVDPTTGRLTFATETNVGEDAYFVGAFGAP